MNYYLFYILFFIFPRSLPRVFDERSFKFLSGGENMQNFIDRNTYGIKIENPSRSMRPLILERSDAEKYKNWLLSDRIEKSRDNIGGIVDGNRVVLNTLLFQGKHNKSDILLMLSLITKNNSTHDLYISAGYHTISYSLSRNIKKIHKEEK